MIYLRLLFIINFLAATSAAPKSPSIDGKISEGEWQQARTHSLKGGGTAYTLIDNTTLYIAMKGHAQGWSHVYLVKADTLNLLHASAALGMSRYVQRNGSWENIQKFNWALRDRSINETAIRKMEEHYSAFGWVANNNMMSSENVLEFKIDLQTHICALLLSLLRTVKIRITFQ